ncbi:MAG TPA: hypothetical protein VMR49_02410 [Candidatus Paceibacterota bacterium]|jgi:hypothetical protein|nr:hypothetical protein [Candidatus Paceibacterota bacterium]
MKKFAAKIIIFAIMVFSLLSAQVFSPLPVSAAVLNYDHPNGSSPYKLKASDIANPEVFMSVVACTGIINTVAGAIQGLLTNLITVKAPEVAKEADIRAGEVTSVTAGAAASTEVEGTGNTSLEQLAAETDKLLDEATIAQKFQDDQAQRDAQRTKCLDGIAIQLARNQLTKMTKDTMNWITTGFNGNPFFVGVADSFMNNLTNDIVQKETNILKNPGYSAYYPYGRSFSLLATEESAVHGVNLYAQSLTNNLILGSTPKSFATDFSQGGLNNSSSGIYSSSYDSDGGWDGWLGLTMNPANNPLGFTLLEGENIAKKQSTAVAMTKEQLAEGNGYLPDQRCVKWQLVDKAGNLEYDDDGSDSTTTSDPGAGNGICILYKTVTPGSAIRDKVAKYINSPETQLELGQTMNDALNLLFTKLLSQFENQGLVSLGTTAVSMTNGGSTLNGTNINNNGGGFTGSFDLTRDIPALIKTQNDYKTAANKSLKEVLPFVVPAVGKLDYCIPGPNSNWQSNSSDTMNNLNDYLTNIRTQSVDIPAWKFKLECLSFGIISYLSSCSGDNTTTRTDILTLPDPSTYKSAFDGYLSFNTNLWKEVKAIFYAYVTKGETTDGPFIFFMDNDSPLGPFKSYGQIPAGAPIIKISQVQIDGKVTAWTDYIKNLNTEYKAKIDALYGPNSVMQSGFDSNLNPSSDYLPMAQAGLSITKDLKVDADNITSETKDYTDSVSQATSNIYKLQKIDDQVQAILKIARDRRAANRAKAGEDPFTQYCLDNEVINITGNDCIDPATGNTIECIPTIAP